MTDVVLRNGSVPADDPLKDGRGKDLHRDAQFGGDSLNQARVVPADDFRPMPAAAERAQQHHALRSAVRVGGGAPLHAEHVGPAAARRKVAETVKRPWDVAAPKAERDDRDTVVRYAADEVRQIAIEISQNRRLLVRGTSENRCVGGPAIPAFAVCHPTIRRALQARDCDPERYGYAPRERFWEDA